MKKEIISLVLLLLFSLTGCTKSVLGNIESENIETLKGWTFQYNQGTSDYSLFFGLLNKNDKYISADIDVDIRIVNESGEEVYTATKSVTKENFGIYSSQAAGEQYLAEIHIPTEDIVSGKSSNGTVYLTVYKDDTVRFDEVNCSALYCLPVLDVELESGPFPIEINVKGFDGSTESKLQIDNVSYVYEKDYMPFLKITVLGTKTDGKSNSGYDIISYKLYDSEGYIADTGHIYLSSLSQGDKFKDDSIIVYDITPGETYKLVLSDYEW